METRDKGNEPTCFLKILHDFRTDSIPGRRMSALRFPGLGTIESENPQNVGKPVKLEFDDSFLNETDNHFIKKRKIEGDTPDSQKLNDSYMITSPWESRKMKADLAEARAEIARLESRMCQMETVHKETIVLFEQEKRSLQQSLDKERTNSVEFEQRLKALRKQKAELKQELIETQSNLRQDKLNVEEEYQKLLQENMVLRDKFSELDANSGDKVLQLERKLSAAEQQVVDVREELAASKDLLNKLREELNEKRVESHLWESDKAKLSSMTQRVQELEYEKESHQKAISMAKTQQSKLLRLFDLEKEVASLKEENKNLHQAITNKLYLEDVVADLRNRVSVLQEREQTIVSLKVELGVAQTRLDEWSELSKHILGQSGGSPISLRQCFENLQKKEVVLTSENSQLKSRIKELEASQKEYETESQLLRTQIDKLKQNVEQNNVLINRLRKQNSLIAWERNDLRQLVDSCQKEFTMTSSAALDMQHLSRIDALEKVLEGYKKRNEQLEKEVLQGQDRLSGAGSSSLDSAESLKIKIERDNLLKEKEELTKKIDNLQEQLEYRALKGDFDSRQTKILHLRANPLSEATSSHMSEIEKYQSEIAKLRERVKLLQEGKTHDLTQTVEDRVDVNAVKEIDELKKKLSSQERQNQRLREVFKMTSQEFREAINVLLGYKVDVLLNKKYRLSSLYAETLDQHLIFQMNQSGGMDLLATPYSETIGELIEIYLQQENSIPVFLSALTMQLFQRQTMCVSEVNPQDDAEIILSD